jgi:hypothetical protein
MSTFAISAKLWDTMSETKDKVDARSLWLPASMVVVCVAAIGGALLMSGMWIQQINDSRDATASMAGKLDSLISQQSTMQGSLNALMEMQATLSRTSAEVGSLESRMDSFEVRLQTQEAWIQTTRQKLIEQGFRSPDFRASED